MAWILLILGGVCEVGFTTCLQASDNLTNLNKNWLWAAGFFVFLFFSMYLLNEAAKHISMGTCYTVWTGIGAVGTALVGIFVYNEPTNMLKIIFIFTLIASIAGLKAVSHV
ncbi:MAG: multidrug efflux SMR transporter [Prevotellaceae bacterium]|jgi:quaternary ammonium compound-resistance protein SugE|nr:multidrug efflux SMR transporter [Prevotellaceae bacterium]